MTAAVPLVEFLATTNSVARLRELYVQRRVEFAHMARRVADERRRGFRPPARMMSLPMRRLNIARAALARLERELDDRLARKRAAVAGG